MSTKIDLGYKSWLRVGTVLAPYNIRPKTVPLIKIQWRGSPLNVYFPK